jgi:TPP-dependent indolepyruvate ferredoxin oxidoreductase alpha subunit
VQYFGPDDDPIINYMSDAVAVDDTNAESEERWPATCYGCSHATTSSTAARVDVECLQLRDSPTTR